MSGILAPRGKGRTFLLTVHVILLSIGVAGLGAGIVAVVFGQPYHVWYPLVLIGGVLTVVLGVLFPVVVRRYREAEQSKLEAEELRRASS
jgi:hypothetical protein